MLRRPWWSSDHQEDASLHLKTNILSTLMLGSSLLHSGNLTPSLWYFVTLSQVGWYLASCCLWTEHYNFWFFLPSCCISQCSLSSLPSVVSSIVFQSQSPPSFNLQGCFRGCCLSYFLSSFHFKVEAWEKCSAFIPGPRKSLVLNTS